MLGTYNAILQTHHRTVAKTEPLKYSRAGSNPPRSTTTISRSNQDVIQLHQDLLVALQNLGYHHLVELYLKGFAIQSADKFPELSGTYKIAT